MADFEEIDITKSDDEAILYSQLVRQNVVKVFVRDGKMTSDPEELRLVIAAANGISQAAIGNKRIKVDEKANSDNKETAAAIIQLLEQARIEKPFETNTSDVTPPVLEEKEFPDPVMVPGETEISPRPLNYESFLQENNMDPV